MALEHAVQDQVGAGERGGDVEQHAVDREDAEVGAVGVPGVVEDLGLVGDVEDGRDAVVREGRPGAVERGVRERLPVDQRGRDHRGAHARRREARELCLEPVGIAQREVRHRVQPPPAFACTTVSHQRFQAAMLAVQRGQVARAACAPRRGRSSGSRSPRRRRAPRAGRGARPGPSSRAAGSRRSARAAGAPRARAGAARRSRRSRPASARRRPRARGRARSTRTWPSGSSTKRIASSRRAGSMCSSQRPRYSKRC